MRKRIFGRQLSRERDTRRALFRSLVRALVEHGEIKTTKIKAKATQPLIERLISVAKKKDIAARRKVFAKLGNDKATAKKIFTMVDKIFKNRNSGFTRITNLGRRRGDNAEIVKLEFVEKLIIEEPKPKKKTKTKKTKKETKKESKKTTKKTEKKK